MSKAELETAITFAKLELLELEAGNRCVTDCPGVEKVAQIALARRTQHVRRNPLTIIRVVCSNLHIPKEKVLGPSRVRSVVSARHAIIYLTDRLLKKSSFEIGEIIGGRDHSSVIHALATFQDRVIKTPGMSQRLVDMETEILKRWDHKK